ncbi:outer membrane beta-barrel protein [Vibrio metschnikovii]|uniref:outer membrane beta-barrel protein n=1 Tax=Vibrio metschnikovii TaxID=28172 RepID=UPI001C30D146|nr:outer membrane beta-barrel protein [Vibrio metschnikovii]
MKSVRLLMMNITTLIILTLATFYLRAESQSNHFYAGSSIHYNVNDKDNDLTEKLGASIRAGYLFTPNWSIESSYGSYGRNVDGDNVYAYQLKGLYLHQLVSDFSLYTGIGGYVYDSKLNPSAVIGVKKQLDKKLSAQFSYEYLYKGHGDDDIYALSLGMNFYF